MGKKGLNKPHKVSILRVLFTGQTRGYLDLLTKSKYFQHHNIRIQHTLEQYLTTLHPRQALNFLPAFPFPASLPSSINLPLPPCELTASVTASSPENQEQQYAQASFKWAESSVIPKGVSTERMASPAAMSRVVVRPFPVRGSWWGTIWDGRLRLEGMV